jgi:hypothetical protein
MMTSALMKRVAIAIRYRKTLINKGSYALGHKRPSK